MGKHNIKEVVMSLAGNSYIFFHKCVNRLNNSYYRTTFRGEPKELLLFGRINCIHPKNVKIGDYCNINDGVMMHAVGGITLGNHVTISTGAKLISTGYNTSDWVEKCEENNPNNHDHINKEILLGAHTWIGASAIVLPGVRITGKGVIVAAGSVLKDSIDEDYVVVAGSPAKIVKRVKSR